MLVSFIGFAIAAYAVVANDVIQTLGTFISSNSKTKPVFLYLFIASILVVVLVYGWTAFDDVSYERLNQIEVPKTFSWWYVMPPCILLVITRFGIPVSTTFLMLSIFSSTTVIEKIIFKSLIGYLIAFIFAFLMYIFITKITEKYFTYQKKVNFKWVILQWLTTACLWGVWLMQDLANIYIFLPRKLESLHLGISLAILLMFLGYTFSIKGGKIQQIINSKSNTRDIRSASIIDGIYAIILFFFKEVSDLPMSTTWVFVGLLAGRELSINFIQRKKSTKIVYKMVKNDFLKILLGLIISIAVVIVFKTFHSLI